jgi:LuxR family maltose regulon positive regulatory protein
VLVRVCIALGDLTRAEQALDEMKQVHNQAGIPLFRPWIEGLQVRLWLAQGNLAPAVEWAEQTPYHQEALVYNREIAYLALVRVYLADERYSEALQLLAALLKSAEQVSRVGSIIPILALQVAALQASGKTQEACHVLDCLLTLAHPEGYMRAFLDVGEPMHSALQAWLKTSQQTASPVLASYAQTILAAFEGERRQVVQQETILPASKALPSASSVSSHAAEQLLEPLTPRELEVLHLLAKGATNREIADQLVISLTTVKKHIGSLFLKLAAENRTHAVARARELSLL